MIRRPPRSTLFPTRRSSDLETNGVERHGPREASPARCFPPVGVLRRAGRRRGARDRGAFGPRDTGRDDLDRKSTRLNSSHGYISYAVFCLKKKKKNQKMHTA